MQSQEITEVPALDVDKAIRVVQEYVRELEAQKPEEETANQVSIQSKTQSKNVKPKPSFPSGICFSSEISGIFGTGYR